MFQNIPPVVKNLLIINILVWVADIVVGGNFFIQYLGLHHWASDDFLPHQLITHMFMHSKGSFMHILFNMFGLWMFGRHLEIKFGSKKFLIFYFACGLGSALISLGIETFRLDALHQVIVEYSENPTPEAFAMFINDYIPDCEGIMGGISGCPIINENGETVTQVFNRILYTLQDAPANQQAIDSSIALCEAWYEQRVNTVSVGASGAIYGIFAGFGLIFPNVMLMLLFPPIPMKAKWLVLIMIGFELYLGIQADPGDNVGHFAHLGGAVIAFILIKIWRLDKFYDNL